MRQHYAFGEGEADPMSDKSLQWEVFDYEWWLSSWDSGLPLRALSDALPGTQPQTLDRLQEKSFLRQKAH